MDDADDRRLALYQQGMTDGQIAAQIGVTRSAIAYWRKSNRLAANQPSIEKHARRMSLYRQGMNDCQIAVAMGVHRTSIAEWRTANGLEPNASVGGQSIQRKATRATRTHPIVATVLRALGPTLSRDIAEDAAQDIAVDILTGKISPGDIKASASRYANRVIGQFASRYGPRSLDERVGEDDFTLMDIIPDHHASSWLEEMGATVW